MKPHNGDQYVTSWQALNPDGGARTHVVNLGKEDTATLLKKIEAHYLEAFNLNVHKLVDVTDEFLPPQENERMKHDD